MSPFLEELGVRALSPQGNACHPPCATWHNTGEEKAAGGTVQIVVEHSSAITWVGVIVWDLTSHLWMGRTGFSSYWIPMQSPADFLSSPCGACSLPSCPRAPRGAGKGHVGSQAFGFFLLPVLRDPENSLQGPKASGNRSSPYSGRARTGCSTLGPCCKGFMSSDGGSAPAAV